MSFDYFSGNPISTVALKRVLALFALAAAFAGNPAVAAEKDSAPPQTAAQKQEWIYGSQLMTRQERSEHRAKMRAAKTPEEREQIRKEHHERMKERARERGVTLPDEPPDGGGGGFAGGRNR